MIQLRLTQAIYQEIKSDLSRHHKFAFERMGYVFIKPSGKSVLVATGYEPIPDEFYINDQTVGACVDYRGIAIAMKRADKNKEGILHTHIHGKAGTPKFSTTDISDHSEFLRSFRNATPTMPHGFLLLSSDKLMARVWQPNSKSFRDVFRYTIVGMPLAYYWTGGQKL